VRLLAAQDRLAAFRGGFPAVPLSARRIAGLLDAPGCVRRQVVDAACVPIDDLAALVGCPPAGQSPFALARARQFERLVTDNDMGPLLRLVRELLGLPVSAAREKDLSASQVSMQFRRNDTAFRAELTRRYVREMLDGDDRAVNLLRSPILELAIGGVPMPVEPDAVAYAATGPLHPVEIRSFPCVDGFAEPGQVSAAARQTAVQVLATRELVVRLGHDPQRVSTHGLLVLPENFSLNATGEILDVAPQARRLRRYLDDFPRLDTLARHVPEGVELPHPRQPGTGEPSREASAQAAEALAALPYRFTDGCVACPLFAFCRAEADAVGSVARLGSLAANVCGDVSTVEQALALAHGERTPVTAAERAVAAELGRAATALALAAR